MTTIFFSFLATFKFLLLYFAIAGFRMWCRQMNNTTCPWKQKQNNSCKRSCNWLFLWVTDKKGEVGFHRSGFSPKRVFTKVGFHRMPLGVGFHQMPFGGGDSPKVRGGFPTVLWYIRWITTPVGFHRMPLGVGFRRMPFGGSDSPNVP